MSRIMLYVAVFSLLTTVPNPCPADAEKDFRDLFGEQIKRVRSTADMGDDVQLAKLILDMAGELEGRNELKVMMLEQACELAWRDPSGHKHVLSAVKRLAKIAPKRAGEWQEYYLNSCRTVYVRSKGKSRKRAGEYYLDELVKTGDALRAGGDGEKANAYYQQALTVAAAIRSKKRDRIADKIRSISTAIQKNKMLDDLNGRLEKDPKDTEAREALIRIHLLDHDDSVGAAKLLTDDVDESMREHIPLAARAVRDLSIDECLKLAEWYNAKGQSQSSQLRKAVAYRRARDYFSAFRAGYGKSDIKSLKAKIEQHSIEKKLEIIKVPMPKRKTLYPAKKTIAKRSPHSPMDVKKKR